MTKNVFGFILSIGVLFAAYAYLTKSASQDPNRETSAPNASDLSAAQPPVSMPQETQQTLPAVPTDFTTEGSPEAVSIETPDLSVSFASKGGCIEGLTLKNYSTEKDTSDSVALIEKLESCKALGLKIGQADLREAPAQISLNSPLEVLSQQRTPDLHVRRLVQIDPNGYSGKVILDVTNVSSNPVESLIELEIGATSTKDGAAGFLTFNQAGLRHLAYHSEEDGLKEFVLNFEKTPSSDVLFMNPSMRPDWVASGGTYFHLAFIPTFADQVGIRFERQPYNMQPNRQSPPERTIYEGWLQHSVALQPGANQQWVYELYAGPKALDLLKAEGHKLEESINYGFFRIVAWPMFRALHFIEGLVGNWGIAIVILTILIRILFYPLAAKSYSAGKKMQKIKPLMDEVREKFKDDKQKQQQEMMSLMAKEGVNPLGGCLPILPQIPVFFGLNAVLLHTFDLRQAPFGLWITDLSTKDPLYISPIIMAGLMYLQQKLIPMPSMEPAQAKMMRFLPVIFALFMISYPSGLVVYIVTSTFFSIAQQRFMMSRNKEA